MAYVLRNHTRLVFKVQALSEVNINSNFTTYVHLWLNLVRLVYVYVTALPSVCGEYAFPPLLFTPCFTYFIYSAILHTQIIHIIYLVFYLLFVFYVYFTTPSMH